MGKLCVRWGSLMQFDEKSKENILMSLSTSLNGILVEYGFPNTQIQLQEEIITRVDAINGVQRKGRLAIIGTLPMKASNILNILRENANSFVIDIDFSELRVELSPGERLSEVSSLINIHGETDSLFSLERKGFPTLLLVHEARTGSSIDALYRVGNILRKHRNKKQPNQLKITNDSKFSHPLISISSQKISQDVKINGVALSVDRSISDFRRSILCTEDLDHLWVGEDAWNAQIIKTLGISAVPTAILLDRSKNVIWRGHPGMHASEMENAISSLIETGKYSDATESDIPVLKTVKPFFHNNTIFEDILLLLNGKLGDVEVIIETTTIWNCKKAQVFESDTRITVDGRAPNSENRSLQELQKYCTNLVSTDEQIDEALDFRVSRYP